jgi:hypothetical protein
MLIPKQVIPMIRIMSRWATAPAAILALAVSLGFAATVNSAEARPSDAYFVKVDRDTTTASQTAPARVKRADGNVCCSVPRKGKLALVKPSECRQVKGKIVETTKCARVKRVSAAKFSNIVLKRGAMSRGKSSAPGSLSPGAAANWTCSNGNYYPCWCSGADSCNLFIAACVEVGGDVGCTEHNEQGQPTGCACNK